MQIKTVQELIDELNEIEDKTKPIFGYVVDYDSGDTYEIAPILMVDDSISDRVDINIDITGC